LSGGAAVPIPRHATNRIACNGGDRYATEDFGR
jgi:hypothetical protein